MLVEQILNHHCRPLSYLHFNLVIWPSTRIPFGKITDFPFDLSLLTSDDIVIKLCLYAVDAHPFNCSGS